MYIFIVKSRISQ